MLESLRWHKKRGFRKSFLTISLSQVVGSSGGLVAGVLSLTGGILTFFTAGAAVPILATGLGLGVASGLTGGGAALSKHIIKSQQMNKCKRAIEADCVSTDELAQEVKSVRKKLNAQITLDAGKLGYKIHNLVNSSLDLAQLSRGATAPGEAMIATLGNAAAVFGKNFGDDVGKFLAKIGGRALAGSVTVAVAGVTIALDLYSLTTGVTKLVRDEGSKAAKQVRAIADQLEEELDSNVFIT